jgi:RasGEF domain/RasGEF N-terminal motif
VRSGTLKTKSSDAPPKASTHSRAFSFSTVDDSHKSSSELKDGVLRIVIDRSATSRPKTAEPPVLPTLEIPIPHFRLGKPHFSAQGTPVLRSSAYTRTSEEQLETLKSASKPKEEFLSPGTPALQGRDRLKQDPSDTFVSASGTTSDLSQNSSGLAASTTHYSYREPINPEVFDKLTTFKDDASVVRYSQKTGAITAATPARIVAQISSEAFMDYELVSDFFLTFRAYLSTENLLNLLLARLRWAINRLEDDGRIIRIRTFAALRHWILNYFVDDFVVNRKLRVRFCDEINEMYREVSKRSGGGVSDLKILLDLKRCWNGRCSLYWDSAEFVVDTKQEADIVPGGIMGSRDPSLTDLGVTSDQQPQSALDVQQDKSNMAKTWYGHPPLAHSTKAHKKQPSTPSARAPASPTSEQSLQPASCSLPARPFKRSPPQEGNLRGPYPISVQLRNQNPPAFPPISERESQRRLSQAHKRSASTSDSIRGRSSLGSTDWPAFLVNPHAGSLIRGNLYPPAAPFVDVIAPESPPSQRSQLNRSPVRTSAPCDNNMRQGSAANPGVKTIMGSIRRALSSKQTISASASHAGDVPHSAPLLWGKTSGLPLNMTRSMDTLREKKSIPGTRHHIRIDLLCAAVSQSYQMAQAKASQDSLINHGLHIPISDIHEDSASQQSLGSRDFSIEAGDVQRILSHDMAQFDQAEMSDASGLAFPSATGVPLNTTRADNGMGVFDFTTAGMMSMPLLSTETMRRSSIDDHRRSSSVDTALARRSREQETIRNDDSHNWPNVSRRPSGPHFPAQIDNLRSTGSTSGLSRTHKSNQSSVRRQGAEPSLDPTVTSFSINESNVDVRQDGPTHTLRRRPGGNLRNIENVQDLTPVLRRQSTGSFTTRSGSVSSVLVMGGHRAPGSKQRKPAAAAPLHPVSLIRTHSSQHLRPSFEAAISGFSAIPDDDDGGLEATLLKLEGRYEKSSPRVRNTRTSGAPGGARRRQPGPGTHPSSVKSPASSNSGRRRPSQSSSVPKTRKPSTRNGSTRSGPSKSSNAASEDSYSSIPLLERGLTDDSMKKPRPLPRSNPTAPIPRPLFDHRVGAGFEKSSSPSHRSIEVIEKTESMGRIPKGSSLPDTQLSTTSDSFLLDEDDNLTDLSSELSVDVIDQSDVKTPTVSPTIPPPGSMATTHAIPIHPLAHPPSPAFSFHHAITPTPIVSPMIFQQKPLTPQPSPTQGHGPQSSQAQLAEIFPKKQSAASATVTTSAGHIPFVLACESEVIAQQLTLVEKAALSEIDWSDLVDMKWDNKSPNILNWVEYLASKDNKGIDIVITRFNLVVKWALSEIVMTQNIHERSRAITKYIHIAAHAKQLHNYATMLQITIALTSIDCTRLKSTWDLVPEPEKASLKEMETLIQPIRNFHDLRIEMETANLQDGCIPFVGKLPHRNVF